MWVTWNSWLLGHQRVTSDLPTSQQKTCDLAHLMHLTHQLHWNTSSQMSSRKHVARRSILYIWIRIQEDALFHPGRMHGSGGYMCYLFWCSITWTSPTETGGSSMSHRFLGGNGIPNRSLKSCPLQQKHEKPSITKLSNPCNSKAKLSTLRNPNNLGHLLTARRAG